MRISLIVAMQKELELLLPLIENPEKHICESREYFSGTIASHEVSLIKCGIGKVNAALCTDSIIRNFKPDLVLNSGVAGGADSSMRVLDVLIASGVAYHDVWCGPGTEWGAANGCNQIIKCYDKISYLASQLFPNTSNIRYGLICSGDIFISKVDEITKIKSHFPTALAVDMESGAIAQTCYLNKVNFAVIRVISDTPGQADNISQYENFWNDAPKETFQILKQLLMVL